jgi:redox-sensitive bicupin YhaK (pirin superfamily)
MWIAQPEETRNGDAGFEHHSELPQVDLGNARATVLVGELGGVTSPARRDTDHVGAELLVATGSAFVPLRVDYEYGLIVLEGAVGVEKSLITPGHLGYLAPGSDELTVSVERPARVMLIGGLPLVDQPLIWWNFVAKTREEIEVARASWQEDDGRFGHVDSVLERILAPQPMWVQPS